MNLVNCPRCTEEVTDDSDFCPHCGVMFDEAGEVFCEKHPQKKATGVCIICRAVVCGECGCEVSGKILCGDHQNVEVQQDWAEVFRSTEISEAELVKSILESAGHKVSVQNFNSVGFVWDGGGDSPISRSNIHKPAIVLVPIPEFLEAVEEVEEWQSSHAETDPDDETNKTEDVG